MQRKSFLQLAIRASWSQHLLAQTSFQLAPEAFWREELTSQFFCYSNSSKNITCPLGKLKTEFTSPIAKSTSPGLSDTTFFARWFHLLYCPWRKTGITCGLVVLTHNCSPFIYYSSIIHDKNAKEIDVKWVSIYEWFFFSDFLIFSGKIIIIQKWSNKTN